MQKLNLSMINFWYIIAITIIVFISLATTAVAQSPSLSSTRVVSSPNSSTYGQSVTLTAEVDGLGGGAPLGNVIFKDGSATLKTGALNSTGAGQATISVGGGHTCALAAGGWVTCWGFNFYGALGDNTRIDKLIPEQAKPVLSGVTMITAGEYHSCALSVEGSVKCWGLNLFGLLGQGDDGDPLDMSVTPLNVAGFDSPVKQIQTSYFHTCAVTTAGDVYCWGDNAFGQLGEINYGNYSRTPTKVSYLGGKAKQIAAGKEHTCAILTDGSVNCWGHNSWNQLGHDAGSGNYPTPHPVQNLGGAVKAIGSGEAHSCALLVNGTVNCWGQGYYGQNGDLNYNRRYVAQSVNGLEDVAAIAVGKQHNCALLNNGGVKCWGDNTYGALGVDSSETPDRKSAAPINVPGLTSGVVAIAAGDNNTCATLDTGALKCWGRNSYGQLGDGTRIIRSSPVSINNFTSLVRSQTSVDAILINAGNRTVEAVYSPRSTHQSSSATVSHVVSRASTTTQLSSSSNPSTYGQTLTLSATVTSTAPISPGGTVTFKDGSTSLGSAVISGGLATLTIASLSADVHSLTAVYAGNDDFLTSTSSPLSQTVSAAATTSSLSSSPNPAVIGQTVSLIATVASGGGTPTGTVVFKNASTTIGTAPLNDGVATLTTAALTLGLHSLSVEYPGDGNFTSSASSTLSQEVMLIDTATSLVSSADTSGYGESVTLTATVTYTGGTPTGTVTFKDGSSTLGTAALTGGVATLSTSSLALGPHSFTASYGASDNFKASVSTALSHTVTSVTTLTTLSSSARNSNYGETVTLTAVVTSPRGTPTGTVTFKDGSSTLGTASTTGATVSFSTSSLSVGNHSLSASYAAEGNFGSSTSVPLSYVVNKVATTANLALSLAHANPRQSLTLTATVQSPSSNVKPSGSVSFFNGANSVGSAMLNASGVASFNVARLVFGKQNYSAVYSGSATHLGATSSTTKLDVDYKLGSEIRVNASLPGPQTNPAAATGFSGDVMAVWESANAVGQRNAIKGRLISAVSGAPVGNSDIIIADAGDGVGLPSVAGLSNKDFVVVWQARDSKSVGQDIWMRLFTQNGLAKAPAVKVNTQTTGNQNTPVVTALANGFNVAWASDVEDRSAYGIVSQRFTNAGVKVGVSSVVNKTTSGSQLSPNLISLSAGGYVVGWSGPRVGGYAPYYQRFNGNGQTVGNETLVASALTARPNAALASLPSNAFLMVWDQIMASGSISPGIFLQRYGTNGAPSGVTLRLDTFTGLPNQGDPAVAGISDGRYVAAWTKQDENLLGITAKTFQANGAPIEVGFSVNTTTTGQQRLPVIAPLGANADYGKNYLVLWTSQGPGSVGEDVYMQRFVAP